MQAKIKKIAIIKANFNHDITDEILDLAEKELNKKKIIFDVYEVSGSFEIPCKIMQIEESKNKYDSYLAIGCIIKGETAHFECISQAVSYGLMKISIELTKPILFDILTCYNKKQARIRIKNIIKIINNI